MQRLQNAYTCWIGSHMVIGGLVGGIYGTLEMAHEYKTEGSTNPFTSVAFVGVGTICGAGLSLFPLTTPILLYTHLKKEKIIQGVLPTITGNDGSKN